LSNPDKETPMSVYMLLQVNRDPKRLQDAMSDRSRWDAINDRAKANGAIHHQFLVSPDGGTIAVFDEWETPEGFQRFFDSSPEIPQMMAEAGVTSEPQVAFWHKLDTPDAF
jgi:hypothetical protein